jgi:hypothetical protein
MNQYYIKVINYCSENIGAVTQFNLFFASKENDKISLRDKVNSVILCNGIYSRFKSVKNIEDFYEAVEYLGKHIEKISRGTVHLESNICMGSNSHV